ncbi:MAG: hypothetical protein J6C76_01650 [Oscillospiraceae bacterium]|nr:hypothetical protein [Oscillospiraceae bacterium]MBQ5326140.1 hypothetical protein [Oscillospiraceae bacterium]
MNYKHYRAQAVRDLTKYKYLKNSVTVLQKQIRMLKKVENEQINSTYAATADALPYAMRIEQLTNTLNTNRTKLRCIEYALSVLPKSDRDNLSSFYINRYRNSVRDLARKEYTDRSTLYRRAQRSLDKYVFAYFGILPPS